jgi:hypothetical protein
MLIKAVIHEVHEVSRSKTGRSEKLVYPHLGEDEFNIYHFDFLRVLRG